MRIGVGFMILPAWAVPAETRPDQWRIENISMSSFIGHSLAALLAYLVGAWLRQIFGVA